ncbi:magnesium chelatase [Streptomyces sp. NPDC049040]|uniref:magnesium chelatase n=1 Tax=Streptomyces sp. NPDC049040 TaxID=3365593 RepID=UPI00371BF199
MTAGEDPGELRRLLRAFGCARAEPRLNGVLLFDVPQEQTAAVVALFAAAFGTLTPTVVLGAATREDDLWSHVRLTPAPGGGIEVTTRHGGLVEVDPQAPPATAVVTDLARLGLPGLRAAVSLIGADVAAVQRHGVAAQWRPRAHWLAFCRTQDAGRVSPHVLDRFPLRLSLPALGIPGEPAAVWAASAEHAALAHPAAPVRAGEDAVRRVVEIGGDRERRLIALGRIARALARLDGTAVATAGHVDAAARLIGLPVEPAPPGAPAAPDVPELRSGPPAAAQRPERGAPGGTDGTAGTGLADPGGLVEPLGPLPAPAAAGRPADAPYPEDEAEPLREPAPLRGAWRRTEHAERGPVVGVRRATDLRDLALVPTLLEAAKKRRLRGALTVRPEDMRSHARAAEPDRMLVLLLDHTCRGDVDLQPVLAPYLRWAYTGRAAAAVIEVGGAGAPDELQAQAFLARNVLDPRLPDALDRRPGRASPLAHGLLLASDFIRRAFQQQPTALVEAWFVAVTDGRGNVPLRTSLTGRFDGPVGRAGIDDALRTAAGIGAFGRARLNSVVVDAGAEPCADLPFALADALGGVTVAGPVAAGDRREVARALG